MPRETKEQKKYRIHIEEAMLNDTIKPITNEEFLVRRKEMVQEAKNAIAGTKKKR